MPKINRCKWAFKLSSDNIETKYHDEQWGQPVHDDQELFEMLTLEMFQAGLSWRTILVKRPSFQKSFDNFDYHKIAKYDENKINQLMQNAEIVRNLQKLKLQSTMPKNF